jgi:LDH2 family malate/lactate/ureidoglycolate dehydrogenase
MALDISRFLDVDDFKRTLQDLVDAVRSMTPIVPGERVMVAGDPEKICFEVRRREGIPVDPVKFSEMLSLSPDFSEAVLR